MQLQLSSKGCSGTNRGFADVAHSIALDPAPLDGTSPMPQRQVASALAVQRDGLPALRHKTTDSQCAALLPPSIGMVILQ